MPPQSWAIEAQDLTKSFGSQPALRGVDLKVSKGEFVTVLGPNGAGKTTLIKVLATLSRPSSGTIRIAGLDLRENPAQIRRHIGVVTHQTLLYDDLTAYENLKFYGKMYDIADLKEQIHDVTARVGLTPRLHDRVRTLSRGMQQRLSIARALIHNPSILLLDEPETGLDQHAMAMLEELLATVNPGERTVVVTTHNLERGLRMGNHVVILSRGRIAYEESKGPFDVVSLREIYYRCTGVDL